jgi:myo-inositol-1(or 4)-monophosphatase
MSNMRSIGPEDPVPRIAHALERATEILRRFTPGSVDFDDKGGGDPVTEADRAVDTLLKELLPRGDEGWLSEETADDSARLSKERVWVVDPLDGTREFVAGIPEWCVSVALVENGRAIAGGISNPATGETIIGGQGRGVEINGVPARLSGRTTLEDAVVLASRSEVKRGEWQRFEGAPFRVRPMGSVAYKLSLVAAGLADATWTLVPKHEWDVAAGAALVLAAGGEVYTLDGNAPTFNRAQPKIPGFVAHPPALRAEVRSTIGFALDIDR